MELYLMQHGLALSKELDPEQPLSPVGRDQVEKSALAAKLMGLDLDAMICSTKKRSQQTAAILAQAVNYPVKNILVSDAVKAMTPPARTLEYLQGLQQKHDVQRACIVGHMPNIGELVSLLITNDSRAAIQVENAGLLRVDIMDFNRPAGTLLWYLGVHQMGLISSTPRPESR